MEIDDAEAIITKIQHFKSREMTQRTPIKQLDALLKPFDAVYRTIQKVQLHFLHSIIPTKKAIVPLNVDVALFLLF